MILKARVTLYDGNQLKIQLPLRPCMHVKIGHPVFLEYLKNNYPRAPKPFVMFHSDMEDGQPQSLISWVILNKVGV